MMVIIGAAIYFAVLLKLNQHPFRGDRTHYRLEDIF